MDDAYDVVELLVPRLGGEGSSVPGEVLGLLKHADIGLFVWNKLGDVSHRKDGVELIVILCRVEYDTELLRSRWEMCFSNQPVADELLLLRWEIEADIRRKGDLLVDLVEERDHESDSSSRSIFGEVGCSKERVDGGPGHPGQTCGGDDPYPPVMWSKITLG